MKPGTNVEPFGPVLRTPEACFADLPGFAYAPRGRDDLAGYEGLRMQMVDVAPAAPNGRVALCLHGQPAWSYLYRRMIPGLLDRGFRVVAPDLFGFGRSDKPETDAVYTFDFHRGALKALVTALDLERVTLVCQDWGGILGLTLPMDDPERFDALLVMNTTLGTGDVPLTQGFLDWRAWNARNPDMPIAALMKRSTPHLTDAEAKAYEAPFPEIQFKAGVRRFPELVPDHPDAGGAALSRRARDWWRNEWRGRTAMVVGGRDPVLGPPVMQALARVIRDCPPPRLIEPAGHFVQEWGEDVLKLSEDILA